MKRILLFTALFCIANATAQPFRLSVGREPVRGEIIAYPTLDEALASSRGASKYLTPINEWTHGTESAVTTEFTYPFAWANRQILLHVASASTEYEVLVNGRSAGYNANPNAPADLNITKLSHEGKNSLEIRFATPSQLTALESLKPVATPTIGEVHLLSQPTMRIRDVVVKTWPVNDEIKAEVGIIVRSSALNPRTSRIHYELRTPSNELAASGYKDFTLDMRREDTLRFVTKIPELLRWKTEQPTQYTLILKTQYEGRYAEFLRLKLGFRTIETKNGKMTINGLPVILHAQEIAPDITENEIVRLKEQGYNTLKLQSGIASDKLFDICDMLGMYVIVQAPLDSRSSGDNIRKGGNPSNNPAWQEVYLERTTDTYHATKRHPSVIAFSLAERSANGFNLYESYLNMKQMDEVRPFIYRDADGQWNSDPLEIIFAPATGSL